MAYCLNKKENSHKSQAIKSLNSVLNSKGTICKNNTKTIECEFEIQTDGQGAKKFSTKKEGQFCF